MPKSLTFLCWNVNGIRAWTKKGCFDWFLAQKPDFFCIQETKAHPEQLTEDIRNPADYTSYFDHSKLKKGYSGVAIYVKNSLKKTLGEPEKIDYELILQGEKVPDHEGRFIALHYKDFPNGGGLPERLAYKLKFYDAFLAYILALKASGKNVVFCGDVNVAHTEIDIARPKENQNHVGFLPVERAWVDKVISNQFVDTFRFKHPDALQAYSWWDMKSAARDRNIGWRIDYFFVDSGLKTAIEKAEIHSDIFGSDHCPISLTLSFR